MSDKKNIIDMSNENRINIGIALFIFSILILLFAVPKLIKYKDCENKGGFIMEDQSCFIPENEWQREQLEKYGYFRNESFNIDETMYLLNVTGELR